MKHFEINASLNEDSMIFFKNTLHWSLPLDAISIWGYLLTKDGNSLCAPAYSLIDLDNDIVIKESNFYLGLAEINAFLDGINYETKEILDIYRHIITPDGLKYEVIIDDEE